MIQIYYSSQQTSTNTFISIVQLQSEVCCLLHNVGEVVKTICWANETFLQSSQLFNPTLKYFFYLEKWYFYYFEESLTDTSYTSFNWILQTYEILQQNEVNSVPFQLEA